MIAVRRGRRQALLAGASLSTLLIASCSSGSSKPEDTPQTTETSQVAAPAVAVNTQPSTGYVMLNGYVIVPTGSKAICTRQGEKTTAIIGELGSNTAASAIIENGAVTNVAITDPEDALTLSPGHGTANLTLDGQTHTLSGEAPGVRKESVASGEMPMTFEMSFTCP